MLIKHVTNNYFRYYLGFTLIELIVVLLVISILSILSVPKFISIGKQAKISTLKSAKGTIDEAFKMFSTKVLMPSTIVKKCSALLQDELDCIVINGVEIAYSDLDNQPILYPFGDPIKQLKSIVDIDVNNKVGGPYNSLFNYEDDFDGAGKTNGFWIFPEFDGEYPDIENYKCKIHYLPAGHSLNKTGTSKITIETDEC
ncbi:type II secretion system protein [Shewanella halifaxensis]|uniref:type II secretion system protein n=1 Tax=Shewanella halifaxensis TaxID=271098 RepID=UPI000D59A0CE|nr:type II secretion system protein [Shewanella halifaxensis]